MVVLTQRYTLTGDNCSNCGVPLAKELDGDKDKCKLCRDKHTYKH